MSNTCLVTKLKSSVQDSNLLHLGECVATLAPVEFLLNLSSAVNGTTCTFKLENGNFLDYNKTTNYGDTFTRSQVSDNLAMWLSPIDTSKNMVFHNLSKYDSYTLLVNNDNINNIQYTKAYQLYFYGDVIDFDKVPGNLNNPNFYRIYNLDDKKNIYYLTNTKCTGNANRLVSKCKNLRGFIMNSNNIQSNFELDFNSFSGSSDTFNTFSVGYCNITVDSDSLGRLYKLYNLLFYTPINLMSNKIEISDVIEKWMKNGMPARTFSNYLRLFSCGQLFTFNGHEFVIDNSFLTFDNKNKYAMYYGHDTIKNCKAIISYGATQEEITNWQNSGITVTVVD